MNLFVCKKSIEKNVEIIESITGVPKRNVIAVLKDNAYGHGIEIVATLLVKIGITFFAVSTIDEAKCIRTVNEKARVLILKRVDDEMIEYALQQKIDLMVGDESYLKKIKDCSSQLNLQPYIHVKFTEKLNRWGFSADRASIGCIKKLCGAQCELEGVAVHFKATYNYDPYVDKNMDSLKSIKSLLEGEGMCAKRWHYRTTSDLNKGIDANEILRIGAGLYGIPNRRNGVLEQLITAMRGETRVLATRRVCAGETIGYKGNEYIVTEKMAVALLGDGYAQGIREDSSLFLEGKELEIIYIFLDITAVRVDSVNAVGKCVEVRIRDKGKRSLSEMVCDYGNSRMNKVNYE